MADMIRTVETLPLYAIEPEPEPEREASVDVDVEPEAGREDTAGEATIPGSELVLVRWDESRVHLLSEELPEVLDHRLMLARDKSSPQSNAFRLLRHRLACQGDPRVIVVSSPERREGKTTCAVNLAAALGEESNARVLLLEANTIAPALAKVFGMKNVACVAQQFATANDVSGPWVFNEYAELGMHVGAVGTNIRPPPLERFLFECALSQLKTHYDYIIIDTPPALDSADVNLVAESADGVLLCTRTRVSRRQSIRRAIQQLSPKPVLGVVVMDAPARKVA